MILFIHGEGVLSKPDLGLLIEGQVMPNHLHRTIEPFFATKEFKNGSLTFIVLLPGRLFIYCINSKHICSHPGVSSVPSVRDLRYHVNKFFGRYAFVFTML